MTDASFLDFPTTTYPEKAVIIAPGDNPEAWIIEQGIVRQYDVLTNGSQITLNIYRAGAVLSLGWILHDRTNKHFFVAESDLIVRKVPAAMYRHYLQTSPEASFALLTRVSSGFEGLFDRIVSQGQGDAYSRVLTELKIHQSRFAERDDQGLYLSLSVNELAVRSGLARETVSRMLARMVRRGVITRDGRSIRFVTT